MIMTELSKSQYAKLKNLSYQVYMFDFVRDSNNGRQMLQIEFENYNGLRSEEAKKISYNTLLFPFDIELYHFFLHKKLSDEFSSRVLINLIYRSMF